jgi:kinesin family protein 4/21/27
MNSDENIKVGVRVRPLSAKELNENDTECLNAIGSCIECGDDHRFTYDYSFDTSTTNEQLYNTAARSLLNDVFRGFNATIMAYGQTGSGKTFTMGTDASAGSQQDDTLGVLPRFVNDMFSKINDMPKRKVTASCSLLEIYNDEMRDLLMNKTQSASSPTKLKLDTTTKGKVNVIGLTRRIVKCTDDVLHVLSEGLSERVVGATNMNAVSSRSHAIFEILIDSEPMQDTEQDEVEPSFSCKITFVDLAGSERLKKTGAQGARKSEGIAINKSLLVLGNVINSLCKGLAYIPYRECKLTRLLQNALGGNSRTLFLACVSPASNNLAESLNSLRYANRAREIKNAAVVNMDEQSRIALFFRQREQALKDQLIRERFFGGRDIDKSDPEFLERQKLPSTNDYIDQILRDANVSTGTFVMAKQTISSGSSNCSRGNNSKTDVGISRKSKISKTGKPVPPVPRFSEAHKGKINVEVDLPMVGNLVDQAVRRASSVYAMEMEAETGLFEQEEEMARAKNDFDATMDKNEEEIEVISDDLVLKSEILQQMSDKMKDYADRYNRLRDEFDALNKTAAEQEEEKHRLEQQIARAKQRKHANAMSKGKDHHIEAMKQRLVKLNSTIKEAKGAITDKQREINSLKREKEVAVQLRRTVDKLKARKVTLERQRKESEQRHTQMMADKNRKIMAAQKLVTKITMQKRKVESKAQQKASSLTRAHDRNRKLKDDILSLKRKYNQVVQNNATRAARGGRRKGSRSRDITGEGCHKDGSKMQTNLLCYVRRRVQLSQKAVELQDLIKRRQQMLLDQVRLAKNSTVEEKDTFQARMEANRNAIVIGNQELEHLQQKCGPKWTLLDSLTSIQRGSVVSYLIDEIISTSADYVKADKACIIANKTLQEMQSELRRIKEANKTLKSRAAMFHSQARKSKSGNNTRTRRRLSRIMSTETDNHASPKKRVRSDSHAKENKKSNKNNKNEEISDDKDEFENSFCTSTSDALEMMDRAQDLKRYSRALKVERERKQKAQDELRQKNEEKILDMKGMRGGGESREARNRKGDEYLRQGNGRIGGRRETIGGNGRRASSFRSLFTRPPRQSLGPRNRMSSTGRRFSRK